MFIDYGYLEIHPYLGYLALFILILILFILTKISNNIKWNPPLNIILPKYVADATKSMAQITQTIAGSVIHVPIGRNTPAL